MHELLALELLMVILENPTNDSVEVAVSFIKTIGATLQEISPQGLHSIFERLRAILHEGELEKRCQFIIEGLFAVRKAGFVKSGFPSLPTELDLVEEEDQITHEIGLDEELNPEMALDVFKVDDSYEEHEKQYETIKQEILGKKQALHTQNAVPRIQVGSPKTRVERARRRRNLKRKRRRRAMSK